LTTPEDSPFAIIKLYRRFSPYLITYVPVFTPRERCTSEGRDRQQYNNSRGLQYVTFNNKELIQTGKQWRDMKHKLYSQPNTSNVLPGSRKIYMIVKYTKIII
jgi:hypothetical protein